MDTTNFVEFKKRRDLGAVITDAFKFIRGNWKGFFGTIIKISGPVLIVFFVCIAMYMKSIGDLFSSFDDESGAFNPNGLDSNMVIFLILMAVSGIVFYVLMQMSGLYYIKSYVQNNGIINNEEIRLNVKQNFWRFLGFNILMILMVGIGTLFCLLPGIYLMIVLITGTSILVFEGKDVGDTINQCFALIKGRWWETFGTVFVIGLVVGILGQVFGVPALIYQFVKMGIIATTNDPSQLAGIFSDPIYLVLLVFSYVGQFLLSAITLITYVLIYFDLNEIKNATGSLEKIQNLGSNNYRKN